MQTTTVRIVHRSFSFVVLTLQVIERFAHGTGGLTKITTSNSGQNNRAITGRINLFPNNASRRHWCVGRSRWRSEAHWRLGSCSHPAVGWRRVRRVAVGVGGWGLWVGSEVPGVGRLRSGGVGHVVRW